VNSDEVAVASGRAPLIVQYLYVHSQDEKFFYPTTRATACPADVAARYLECAVAQAASIRLRDVDCDLALAINVGAAAAGRVGAELMECLKELGVTILRTEYRHRPGDDSVEYASSRYVPDAILAAAVGQPPDRIIVLTDLDCVWVRAERVFAAIPQTPSVGCIFIDYPPDWEDAGAGVTGRSRNAIRGLAHELGVPCGLPDWVGGELLTGTPAALRSLVTACDEVDALVRERGELLQTEEQVLTLAGALGKIPFENLAHVAGRVHTGPRHGAVNPPDPLALGLWHLPSEKGLSLRRTARDVKLRRTGKLRHDLTDPARMARRFNVAGTGLTRRLLDDGWLARQRLYAIARQRFASL
jgi:hypothetical protein